ncbi:baseplate J/gp47 family protein [Lelliottia amnigena]|uniref:baseplate J/gp47 family protein n=1 Tax=Lelliottia amnigena TaxID=61646 RepID=UPI00192AAB77|nr:baseplate J/gp47 family protein [Lelliottia amnigena]
MSTEIIDLSRIPPPDIVENIDPEKILQDWIAALVQKDGAYDALLESDPAYIQGEALSVRESLLRQRVNEAIRAVLLASSQGDDLDQLGGNFDVQRLITVPAQPDAIPPVDATYESDEAFRERIQLSWSRLSTAGAWNAYKYFASGADGDVLDVEAYGPETHNMPGQVLIYVLSRTGNGSASEALVAAVHSAVNAKDVRPITDYVTTASAIIAPYRVVADVYIPYGLDADVVMDTARKSLDAYTQSVHRVGGVVARSGIDGSLHQPGVVRVTLTEPPGDVLSRMGEAPWCSEIVLNKVLFNGD